MVTELNHNTIKAAIASLFTTGEPTAVFDSSGGTDKLRSVTVGFPHGGDELQDQQGLYAYVTNNTTLETNRPLGATLSNVIQVLEHTIRYDITFVMQGETGRVTESKMDTMQASILKILEENHDISGNVDDSYPERVEVLRPVKTQGMTKQARKITLKCMKVTGV